MNQEENSWSHGGHIRKPNTIVRGIYWIGDWLGDFKQLAFSTKRGAGHVLLEDSHVSCPSRVFLTFIILSDFYDRF